MTYTESPWPAKIHEVRENWLSIAEIANEYDLEGRFVRYLMESGKVEALRLDGLYMINPGSLDAFLERQHKQVLTTG
jgi:hypothetical protein